MRGVRLEDYAHARLIVVWGTNPHATGIHLVPHVKRAREAGAKLVVVDPRRTPLAKSADLHLALRPGTDVCVALAVIRELFEAGPRTTTSSPPRHRRGGAAPARRALDRRARRRAGGIAPADLARFAECTRALSRR
jgi:anaerobic selenocysteine-containing dehydrogenase